MVDWFHALTGFREPSWHDVQARFAVERTTLRSRVDGRGWGIGTLEIVSVADVRARAVEAAGGLAGRLRVSSVVADVGPLLRATANRGALFQVASQFNLLEMTGPDVTPEDGLTRYADDPTQGPACAIAAGAATIYRNYFAPVGGATGQTAARQIDCLAGVGAALGNRDGRLWTMRNGYAMATAGGLAVVRDRLAAMGEVARADVRDRLCVGLHRDVEVTSGGAGHLVSQVFCSALPVAYTPVPSHDWASFASLVLEGAYEATIWAAVINALATGSPVVFLTQLGGGAFGNEGAWIHAAMRRALELARDLALDVRIVGRGAPSEHLRLLVEEFTG